MKKKIISAVVAAATVSSMCMPVFAATSNTIETGRTPVKYDNRKVLEDGNGQYGMIIPTAIRFTDEEKLANIAVEIVGINGFDIDEDWNTLEVSATVASTNNYKLRLNGTNQNVYADYALSIASTIEETTFGKNTSGAIKKLEGTASLTNKDKATEKGQYTDTLTFNFIEETNVKK